MSEVMARWVPVPGFPSYEISDEGQVRSLRFDPPKIISQREKSTGYLVVALYRNRGPEDKAVHRLVAEIFHGEPSPGEEVRHLNGVKTDNRADNLRWGTRKENVGDMVKAGSHYLHGPQKRYHCGECDMESTAPGIKSHQRNGHRGRSLVKEN